MQIDRTIYHAHPATGEYLGEGEARLDPLDDTFLLIPAHATQDKPPEAGARQAAVWSGSEWTLMADYRGVVYSTESGAALQHDAIGELPEGLRHLEWPGVDFAWSAEAWVLDETARAERLLNAPELLEHPVYAAMSAAWFWQINGLNSLADKGDLRQITKTINGGSNGLKDRQALYERAFEVLQ